MWPLPCPHLETHQICRVRGPPAAGPAPAPGPHPAGPLSWSPRAGWATTRTEGSTMRPSWGLQACGAITCPLPLKPQHTPDFRPLRTSLDDPPASGSAHPTKTSRPLAASCPWGWMNMMTLAEQSVRWCPGSPGPQTVARQRTGELTQPWGKTRKGNGRPVHVSLRGGPVGKNDHRAPIRGRATLLQPGRHTWSVVPAGLVPAPLQGVSVALSARRVPHMAAGQGPPAPRTLGLRRRYQPLLFPQDEKWPFTHCRGWG